MNTKAPIIPGLDRVPNKSSISDFKQAQFFTTAWGLNENLTRGGPARARKRICVDRRKKRRTVLRRFELRPLIYAFIYKYIPSVQAITLQGPVLASFFSSAQ
jgi:hypothetical protein